MENCLDFFSDLCGGFRIVDTPAVFVIDLFPILVVKIYLRMYSSISGCIGLRYSSESKGNPNSGSVNQSHGDSWMVVGSCIARLWVAGSFLVFGVSLSRAVSMFNKHLLMASKERATSSARFSSSNSSGRADLKIKPT